MGRYLGEGTPGEDRPAEHRLTPAAANGSTGCSEPSEPRASVRGRGNGKEGRLRREARSATGGGKPLKVKKPMSVTGTKQGREGFGRSNAPRG